MEPDWKARMAKWEGGIPTETASKDDFKEYLDTKLYQYTENRSTDDNLWDLFRDDFRDFTIATFKRAYSLTEQQLLRAYLRRGGVYVEQNHQRLSIAQSLVDVLEQETKHPWKDADVVQPGQIRTDLLTGPITSVYLTLEGCGYGQAVEQSHDIPPPPPPVEIEVQPPEQGTNEGPPPLPIPEITSSLTGQPLPVP
jgi:hypothetical protein